MAGPTTLFQGGTHASRPAAGAGCVLYWCTDHEKMYRSDGSAWADLMDLSGVGGGAASDLASARYVRSSGNYTITGAGSTSFADVDATNLSLAITTGARRVMVVVQAVGSVSDGSGAIGLDINLDGARLGGTTGGLVHRQVAAANENENLSFTYITDTLTAASHTFKLQWLQANSSHTATLKGSDPTLSFAVVELYA